MARCENLRGSQIESVLVADGVLRVLEKFRKSVLWLNLWLFPKQFHSPWSSAIKKWVALVVIARSLDDIGSLLTLSGRSWFAFDLRRATSHATAVTICSELALIRSSGTTIVGPVCGCLGTVSLSRSPTCCRRSRKARVGPHCQLG